MSAITRDRILPGIVRVLSCFAYFWATTIPSICTAQNFYSLVPCNVLNTAISGSQPLNSAEPRAVSFLYNGKCGVPSTAQAVSFNVQVTGPTVPGFVAFYPADQKWTNTTNINFHANQTLSNNAIQQVSSDGTASVAVLMGAAQSGTTNITIDVDGYFSADLAPSNIYPANTAIGPLGYQGLANCRIVDSRQISNGQIFSGSSGSTQTQGNCGIPTGAAVAALNVTGITAASKGTLFVTSPAAPGQDAVPHVSFDGYAATRANGMRLGMNVPSGIDTDISFINATPSSAYVNYLLDTSGYFDYSAPFGFFPIAGCRALDTRAQGSGGSLSAGVTRSVDLVTPCGLPAGAVAAVANIVVLNNTNPGDLVVFPSGSPLPSTSLLNFPANDTVANNTIANFGAGSGAGKISLDLQAVTSSATADVIVDVYGYFLAPTAQDLPHGEAQQGIFPGPDSDLNEIGFKPDKVYNVSGLDSVNPLNGNLSIGIPIGQSYPVSDALSYGLTLHYNSKIFAFAQFGVGASSVEDVGGVYYQDYTEGMPSPLSNAGTGWLLTMGELRSPTHWDLDNDHALHWTYIAPDGGEHVFYEVLNRWDTGAIATPAAGYPPSFPGYWYTRDGTYLRLSTLGSPGAGERMKIEFPDGRIETYQPTTTPNSADLWPSRWVLDKIADRYGNSVQATYSGSLEQPTLVTLKDSQNRSQKIYYTTVNNTAAGWNTTTPRPFIDHVVLTGFGNVPATYQFQYQAMTIWDTCGNLYNKSTPGSPALEPLPLTVYMLKSVGLPDGSQYSFNYETTESQVAVQSQCGTSNGMLTSMTLPTGGTVKWTYQQWELPTFGCLGRPAYQESVGISQRTVTDLNGGNPATWSYAKQRFFQFGVGGCKAGQPESWQEEQTTVTDPQKNDTVYYFSVLPVSALNPAGIPTVTGVYADPAEQSLPLTRRVQSPQNSNLFLSEQVCQGPCANACNDFTSPNGEPNPPQSCAVSNPLRSTYVSYERDGQLDTTQVVLSAKDNIPTTDLQRRVAHRQVVYNDISPNPPVSSADFSVFDGLGHYRVTAESSSGYPTNTTRETYQGFNPNEQPYLLDANFNPIAPYFAMVQTNQPWLLNTYDQVVKAENPQSNGTWGSVYQELGCFEPGTGFQNWHRVLANPNNAFDFASPQTASTAFLAETSTDLATILVRDQCGNIATAGYYGGDVASGGAAAQIPALSCPTAQVPVACPATPTNIEPIPSLPGQPTYAVNYTHEYGVISSIQHSGASFPDGRLSIDPSTGLPSSRTATNDVVVTNYSFDNEGRLTAIQPGDTSGNSGSGVGCLNPQADAWTEFVYNNAGSVACSDTNTEGGACIQATIYPGGCQSTQSPAVSPIAKSRYMYDGLGRIHRETKGMPGSTPGSTWSERITSYLPIGWKQSESEWINYIVSPPAAPNVFTTYNSYDPFGRPGEIVQPDGSKTDLLYGGNFSVTRSNCVWTGTPDSGGLCGSSNQALAATIEKSDNLGRLVLLQEPNLSQSHYTYDVLDHLTNVAMSTTSGTQNRSFFYDGRGFLQTETHPEKQTEINPEKPLSVVYNNYDAKGHYLYKKDGPNLLTYLYDSAERLTQVCSIWPCTTGASPAQEVKSFTYGSAGISNDRIVGSSRFNHAILGVMPHIVNVMETMAYGGRGGRMNARTVGEALDGTQNESFAESFDYDDLGNINVITYPRCTFAACQNTDPQRTLYSTYDQGSLVDLGFASPGSSDLAALSYYPNLLLKSINYTGSPDVWSETNDPNSMQRPNSIQGLTYRYDGSGNVIAKGLEVYRYDLLNRVVSGTLGDLDNQSYTYDPFGNLTATATDGANSVASQADTTVDVNNHLIGAGYDNAGNMTNWLGVTYTYNELNQLSELYNPGVEQWYYFYDANDERVWSFEPAVYTTRHDRWTIRDLAGNVLRRYETETIGTTTNSYAFAEDYVYRGRTLVASQTPPNINANNPSGTLHYFVDHLGTPNLIRGAAGNNLESHFYFPYGEEDVSLNGINTYPETMRFAGYERDDHLPSTITTKNPYSVDMNLQNLHARYLSPALGRFLSTDNAGIDLHVPQSWNRYTYVRSNPLRLLDTTGHDPIEAAATMLIGTGADILKELPKIAGSFLNPSSEGARAAAELGNQLPLAGEQMTNVIEAHVMGVPLKEVSNVPTQVLNAEHRLPYLAETLGNQTMDFVKSGSGIATATSESGFISFGLVTALAEVVGVVGDIVVAAQVTNDYVWPNIVDPLSTNVQSVLFQNDEQRYCNGPCDDHITVTAQGDPPTQ